MKPLLMLNKNGNEKSKYLLDDSCFRNEFVKRREEGPLVNCILRKIKEKSYWKLKHMQFCLCKMYDTVSKIL